MRLKAAALFLLMTVTPAASQSVEEKLYNAAAMMTADRLCGTAFTSDGRFELEVTKIVFFESMSEAVVRQITAAVSAKQICDFKQSGNSLDKLCDGVWAAY